MATVSPLPRITTSTLASSSAGPFELGFRLFEDDAIRLFVNDIEQDSGFALSATFSNGYDDNATVTFDSSLNSGDVITFVGDQVPARNADYLNTDGLLTKKLNIELARVWASISELRTSLQRSMKVSFGSSTAQELIASNAERAKRSVAFSDDGTRLVAGPSSDEIEAAQGYAEAADASAAEAAAYAGARFDTFAEFSSGADSDYPVGTVARVGSMRYEVVSSGAQFTINGLGYVETGEKFTTRDRLVAAVARGETWVDGQVLQAGDLWFLASSGATDISDLGGLVPAGDVFPDHFADNATPITTDMTAAINAAAAFSKQVFFRPEGYRFTSTLTVPDGSVWTGLGGTPAYGTLQQDERVAHLHADFTTTDNIIEITGSASAFRYRARVTFNDMVCRTHNDNASTDLSAQTINYFYLTNTFLVTFNNCWIENANVTNAISGAGGSNNALRFFGGGVMNIGDSGANFSGSTGQYTYGNGIDTSVIPDSWIEGAFVESCGGDGIRLGANCKAFDCFTDLNRFGYRIYSYDAKIDGGSSKWNMKNGIYTQPSAVDFSIQNITLIGNNYLNATGNTDDTFAIRLTTGNTGFRIANIDARDEISANHPSRTELQNFIHLGGSGNKGVIDGVSIGDTATGGPIVYDPNAMLATGAVSVLNVRRSGTTKNTKGIALETTGYFGALSGSVEGASGSAAVTLGARASTVGNVQSTGAGTLFAAIRNAIGPFIASATTPTVVIDKTGAANTGAVSMRGWSFPIGFNHTGGGGSETNVVAPMANRALGWFTITYGNASTTSFMYAAKIHWDGSTLTVSDAISTGSNIGTFGMSVSGGNLLFSSATSTAISGGVAVVDFTGIWMQSA